VVNAVECSIEIRNTRKAENANLPSDRRMEFRIGVKLGDVVVDGEQIYGDGINVAARLQSLADPGGVCISWKVHEEIGNKLALSYDDLGAQRVKNIAEPVRVFGVRLGSGVPAVSGRQNTRIIQKHWRKGASLIAGLALLAAVIIFVQHLSVRAPEIFASIPRPASPRPPLTNCLRCSMRQRDVVRSCSAAPYPNNATGYWDPALAHVELERLDEAWAEVALRLSPQLTLEGERRAEEDGVGSFPLKDRALAEQFLGIWVRRG
jgi:hypothetical protein